MNTCGFESSWTSLFADNEDPEEIQKEYWFCEWYGIVEDICYTPKSWFFEYSQISDGSIDEFISTKCENQECFARLNPCSAKPDKPYKCAGEIKQSFEQSDRCQPYVGETVILREYKTMNHGEFRCYIHQKKLRAISSAMSLSLLQLKEIQETVDKITFYTNYDDYSVDFTYVSLNEEQFTLTLIEINTPVWLFASSGLFDLDVPADREILWGEYQPDILSYPIIRYEDVE